MPSGPRFEPPFFGEPPSPEKDLLAEIVTDAYPIMTTAMMIVTAGIISGGPVYIESMATNSLQCVCAKSADSILNDRKHPTNIEGMIPVAGIHSVARNETSVRKKQMMRLKELKKRYSPHPSATPSVSVSSSNHMKPMEVMKIAMAKARNERTRIRMCQGPVTFSVPSLLMMASLRSKTHSMKMIVWTRRKKTASTNAIHPNARKKEEGMKNGTRCSTNHSPILMGHTPVCTTTRGFAKSLAPMVPRSRRRWKSVVENTMRSTNARAMQLGVSMSGGHCMFSLKRSVPASF
mmetsp:Transcript_57390/g.136455  ORF Transcript_57390/g.136455 Transcript_57390/m.136455 type:complete len:291 (-) Transcript_57390:254-1126(-)